jgi:hypothetical protein
MSVFLPDTGKALLPKVSQKRPLLLRITCILSFIMCGIMLIAFGCGILSFFISESTMQSIWPRLQRMQPELINQNPNDYFNAAGRYCVVAFLLQVASLTAIVQMWKQKINGLYIYIAAELLFYTIGYLVGFSAEQGGISPSITYLIFDFIFIGVYAFHFFYLEKKQVN